jgi:hypothetical protein
VTVCIGAAVACRALAVGAGGGLSPASLLLLLLSQAVRISTATSPNIEGWKIRPGKFMITVSVFMQSIFMQSIA